MIVDPKKYDGMKNKKINDYDYIEIGTCDWDVLSMTKPNLKGVIVEPIKLYLNNIPNNKNVIKQNIAISNENKEIDFMYYIPPLVYEKNNIVNCIRGCNKLGEMHLAHTSNNYDDLVVKEECKVMTYFTLIKSLNIEYVDFLKIDTEGHDCLIINNILDEISLNPDYILPKYIYFENNTLTSKELIEKTMYRLWENGYIHVFTEDDNTFMYNCRNYFLNFLKSNNIVLNKNVSLNNLKDVNYFQNVHTYIEFGQYDLFKNILKLNTKDTEENVDIIWTTQDINDYNKYKNKCKKIINIIHGGGEEFIKSLVNVINKPNMVVKNINEYKYLKDLTQTCFFIGKYESIYNLFSKIYEKRITNKNFNKNFLMLNGFFNCNNDSIKNTYKYFNQKTSYKLDLYGYDSELGWADVMSENMEINILTKYKFYLHLKGLGYLCNSTLFCMMSGIPIIMSYENYYTTLYHQFIPEELVIFYNSKSNTTNQQDIIPALNYANNMSEKDYNELSHKTYLHGTFFRKYYKDEIEHLNYFMNNIKEI
jgi:hypothetical protein